MDQNTTQQSIYASQKVLFWLTVSGAWGFIVAVLGAIRYLPRFWKWLVAQWRNRSVDRDFYYARREFGYRIITPGTNFVHVRKEAVVAMQQLGEVPLSFHWSGEGEIREFIYPDNLKVNSLPRVTGHDAELRRIVFSDPLQKGETSEYNYVLNCKQTGKPPEPFLSCRSSHRTDRLILRVVFPPTIEPKRVFYVKRNGTLDELLRVLLTGVDHLTGEYRYEVKLPEPNLYHRIEWEV